MPASSLESPPSWLSWAVAEFLVGAKAETMSDGTMFEAACTAVREVLGWGVKGSGKRGLVTFRGFNDSGTLAKTAWRNFGLHEKGKTKHFGQRLFRHCAAEMVFINRNETMLQFRARTQGSGLLEVRRVTRTATKKAPVAAAVGNTSQSPECGADSVPTTRSSNKRRKSVLPEQTIDSEMLNEAQRKEGRGFPPQKKAVAALMYASLGSYEKVAKCLIESWVFFFNQPLPSADMIPSTSSLASWVLEVGQAFKEVEDKQIVAAAATYNASGNDDDSTQLGRSGKAIHVTEINTIQPDSTRASAK